MEVRLDLHVHVQDLQVEHMEWDVAHIADGYCSSAIVDHNAGNHTADDHTADHSDSRNFEVFDIPAGIHGKLEQVLAQVPDKGLEEHHQR